jgi:hypothetical protein
VPTGISDVIGKLPDDVEGIPAIAVGIPGAGADNPSADSAAGAAPDRFAKNSFASRVISAVSDGASAKGSALGSSRGVDILVVEVHRNIIEAGDGVLGENRG